VKYLFDFLDKQAAGLDIGEDEVKHTWKNNRFVISKSKKEEKSKRKFIAELE